MAWTITAYRSYLSEQSRLWIENPSLRASIQLIELELAKNKPRLELYLEQSADRIGPHLWTLPIDGLEVMIEFFPEDRLVQLVWLKPSPLKE